MFIAAQTAAANAKTSAHHNQHQQHQQQVVVIGSDENTAPGVNGDVVTIPAVPNQNSLHHNRSQPQPVIANHFASVGVPPPTAVTGFGTVHQQPQQQQQSAVTVPFKPRSAANQSQSSAAHQQQQQQMDQSIYSSGRFGSNPSQKQQPQPSIVHTQPTVVVSSAPNPKHTSPQRNRTTASGAPIIVSPAPAVGSSPLNSSLASSSGGSAAAGGSPITEYSSHSARGGGSGSGAAPVIPTGQPIEQLTHPGGKLETRYSDGGRLIVFANGTQKYIGKDGYVVVTFPNGDQKETYPAHDASAGGGGSDGRVVYYYASVQTTHTTYLDGVQRFQFADRQWELHKPDGSKEIHFPDQTVKYVFANGQEQSVFPDGSVSARTPVGTGTGTAGGGPGGAAALALTAR